MQRVEGLRKRVEAAESLWSIAGAMKALAAVRIRGFREAVSALEGYRESLELGLQVALRDTPVESGAAPAGLDARGGAAGAVVFGSDLGLVGQFNADIVSHAAPRLRGLGEPVRVAAVGGRLVPHLREAGFEPEIVLPVPAGPDGLTGLAQDLLLSVETWRREGLETLAITHHAYRSGAAYGPRWQLLLPLDREWLADLQARPWPTSVIPTYRAPWEGLFRFLVREHLYVSTVRAAAESQASEHAGRLAAMERAETRIEEHVQQLRQELRDRRQEAVTEELLDLMTGYRASEEERLRGRDEGG
mgnify:CR=1 FL=1